MKPWYMYPAVTRRVLNRIADRTPTARLHAAMDTATCRLWDKVESYYKEAR